MTRTVLITGITSGIGKETALCFAKSGWDIIGHYFSSKDKAEELKRTVSDYGVKCTMLKADFSSEKGIAAFLKKIAGLKVDSLINNAGSYVSTRHFTELTVKDMNKTFMVNTFAPILIASRVFTGMKGRGFGRIVNISSIAAKYGGSASSLHYGASKCSLEAATKTLAREGAGHNILVNTVRPGVIDTEFHRKFPKDMAKRIAMIPLKRMGRPEELAEVVFYLGCDRNSFITNEVIAVAGGE